MLTKRIARAYGENVKPITFTKGDLVLKKTLPFREDPNRKFRPNLEGPYIVITVLFGEGLCLCGMDGNSSYEPVNSGFVKK